MNGGIPQGTKLGPVMFSVMVNDLVSTWPKRAKYVDDLTILEITPRNSPSYLNCIVALIQAELLSSASNPLNFSEFLFLRI